MRYVVMDRTLSFNALLGAYNIQTISTKSSKPLLEYKTSCVKYSEINNILYICFNLMNHQGESNKAIFLLHYF